MTAATRPTVKPKPAAARDPLAILTLAALVIAIALVLVRVTMMEVVRDSFELPTTAGVSTEAISFPGPTTSLVLDLLCFLPAILVLVRRAIDPTYVLRPHWSHLLMVLLGAWVLCSVGWASDKFAALITACDWCGAMAIGWAASQLVRSWARLRIVLAIPVGLLLICLLQGIIYHYLELPETIKWWDQTKAETMNLRGWQPDDFMARQFDRKIRAGEMVAFYKSPNTFAAVTAMCALIAAGFAAQRWRYSREQDPAVSVRSNDDASIAAVIAVPAILSIAMIWMAQSRTALAGLVLSASLFVVLWQMRTWLAAHARTAFILGGVIVALGMAGVIAVGLATGGLLHESLTFRWHYWQGAWSLFLSHPWRGVGWSNFGNTYLQYRLPVAAEEIKDPHNFIVKFMTETGAIGALLAIGWLKLSLYESTRPTGPRPSTKPATSLVAGPGIVPVLLAITLLFAGARIATGAPLSLYMMELLKLVLFAVLLLLATVLCVVRGTNDLSADDRPAPLLLWAAIIAIGGFLLHNLVDFALFENGPLMLFMLVLGAVLGVRHPGVAGHKPRMWAAITALGVLFIGLLAMIGLVVVPVATAESNAQAAEDVAPRSRPDAASAMRKAFADSPVPNADYALRAARFLQGTPAANDVIALLTQAVDADRSSTQAWLDLARFRRAIAQTLPNGGRDDINIAYSNVVKLNPSDAAIGVEYADWLDQAGLRDQAAVHYRTALDANAKMDPGEPRRLPRDRVTQIEQRLQQK